MAEESRLESKEEDAAAEAWQKDREEKAAFEVLDAAKKALVEGSVTLPRPATSADVEALTKKIQRAKELKLPEELIEKAEKMLAFWTDEAARTEAVGLLHQAFHRLDRKAEGKIFKAQWDKIQEALDSDTWSPQKLDEMYIKIDQDGHGYIDYEDMSVYLMHGFQDGHELVKQICRTPPNKEGGLQELFGKRLLKGSYQVDFEISTMEALEGVDIIGICYMTSTTVDKVQYPPIMLQEVEEKKEMLRNFRRHMKGDPEDGIVAAEKNFEVVFCSFDTDEQMFMKTVGTPPWLVMPWDSPWERDHCWRYFSHMRKFPSDPSLMIINREGEVLAKKGFDDIDVQPKFWHKVFDRWINPPPPPTPSASEHESDGF
eukprot:TRINITY_DN49830_c0_g1_i1.p1 TRINITY_DN49830_c0_g1~~TRINITY_DN49830_c0_g1_i1.p1  ORF type:complete len:380 (+),score=122.02 TRINITY_DN49830_c0_g1_i1:25-1140(+)